MSQSVITTLTVNGKRHIVNAQPDTPLLWVLREHLKLISTDNHPTGAGQMATPLVAPAIANAVFQLTGARVRQTPMLPGQVKLALQEGKTRTV